MKTNGWHAEVVREFYRDAWRLQLARRGGNAIDLVTCGELQIHRVPLGEELPADCGIVLPEGMWPAIVAAVDPSPHSAEIRRVEAALVLEQARVEKILDAALAGRI